MKLRFHITIFKNLLYFIAFCQKNVHERNRAIKSNTLTTTMNWMAKHEPNWFRQVPNTPATPEVIVIFILETQNWKLDYQVDFLRGFTFQVDSRCQIHLRLP